MRNTLLPGPQPQEQPFPTVTPPVEVLSGCYTCFDFFLPQGHLNYEAVLATHSRCCSLGFLAAWFLNHAAVANQLGPVF